MGSWGKDGWQAAGEKTERVLLWALGKGGKRAEGQGLSERQDLCKVRKESAIDMTYDYSKHEHVDMLWSLSRQTINELSETIVTLRVFERHKFLSPGNQPVNQ